MNKTIQKNCLTIWIIFDAYKNILLWIYIENSFKVYFKKNKVFNF